jgi:hypothetical protein
LRFPERHSLKAAEVQEAVVETAVVALPVRAVQ